MYCKPMLPAACFCLMSSKSVGLDCFSFEIIFQYCSLNGCMNLLLLKALP